MNKSDADYLLTLPIERRDISLALFISNIILFGMLFLILGAYSIGVLGLLFIPVSLAFAIISESFLIILRNINGYYRVLFTILIGLWYISPFFKFYYSPTSIFLGVNYGYAFLLLLLLLTLLLALKNLDKIQYNIYSSKIPGLVNNMINFAGKSRFMAIFTKSFLLFEIPTVTTTNEGRKASATRIKMYYLLIFTSVIGVILYYLIDVAYPLPNSFLHSSSLSADIPLIAIFIVLMFEFFVAYFSSFSPFSLDPLWLSMGLMKPVVYARHYLLSKALKIFIVTLPINLVFLLNPKTFATGVSALISLPSLLVFASSINAKFVTPQIKYEDFQVITLPNPLKVLVGYIVVTVGIAIIFTDVISLNLGIIIPSIISSIVIVVIALPFLISSKYWEGVVENMVKNGYV
ncbi:hypothetical protein DFR86_00230 [Acidianus sulfidivorans JP7]|uniref:Uncharacterized protein n=1 Tax=Acidianus sulfidivorans JP7 TaxID=619593 RepID=A0A2U9IJ95_9CREN|nr:hypothetical protein [Acidianus sulfidivorans]AWR96128.1 hypothetical protein DFR86_00230 [Acidianus sulfidivorans JP7]